MITCVFSRDCLLFQNTKNSLYSYIPEINNKLQNNEVIYDVMPSNYYFKINSINEYKITYVLGENVNFAFANNKSVEISGYCSRVIVN